MREQMNPIRNQRVGLVPGCALLIVLLFGCRQDSATSPPPAKNDEAMKRAVSEGTSIDKSAMENFYPKIIEDYFQPMDSIGVTQSGFPDQLLDLHLNKGRNKSRNENQDEKCAGPPAVGDAQGASQAAKDAKLGDTREEKAKRPCLTESAKLGRNTWMIWCGGNEGFWTSLANDSLGFIDLLKLVDSRKRNERFRDGGLIIEPDTAQATSPTPGEFGLWLDLPQDPRIRAWRKAYLNQTFSKIAEGKHKSQIGLHKGDQSGKQDQADLYLGDLNAYKGEGYDYPSSYLTTGQDSYYDPGNFYDKNIPPPDIYGLSSGVVGLRLFPNPYFDADAQKKWNPEQYYNDKSYWSDPKLIRPYRVGVSCAYCHASFHPLKPPRSVTQPEWENISGSIGAQYLRIRVAFGNLLTEDQFVYHLLDSQPPGTIDTSLIASDNINNPNTMNAVFKLPQRSLLQFRNPSETSSAESLRLPNLWVNPNADLPSSYYDSIPPNWQKAFADQGLSEAIATSNSNPRHVPKVLLDGSDSIGPFGALARVYLNIGSYWEQWNEIHQPVLGFTPQRPFRIRDCDTHSVYWNATKLRVAGLRDYFLEVTPPMNLTATPEGDKRIIRGDASNRSTVDAKTRSRQIDILKLARGRQVFAKNCIICHSSIQPESSVEELFVPKKGETEEEMNDREAGKKAHIAKYAQLRERRNSFRKVDPETNDYFEHDPGSWLSDQEYQEWAAEVVDQAPFWESNYLSNDSRVPVTLVKTNSSRAMATNAIQGHMWEDFASESYRSLPSPGPISYFNPYTGKDEKFTPRHKPAKDNTSNNKSATLKYADETSSDDQQKKAVTAGGGGVGYYRVPTLVSIWATAPFLHNNSLGLFNNDPSVDGRLASFDDSIRKLLWPEKRLESSSYNNATPERLKADHGLIWRTPVETTLTIEGRRVPYFARMLPFVSELHMTYPWLEKISPLWLPSLICFVGSLLILLVSNSTYRYRLGYIVLAATLGLGLLLALAVWYPQWSCLSFARSIYPTWLPVVTLLGLALTLLLPLSNTWRRYVAYLSLLASLGIGGIVYFNAGRLGDLVLGPIPKGTPVNLIANFNPEADLTKQKQSIGRIVAGLSEIRAGHLQPEDADKVMKAKIAPALMEVNKCPDFVMDKGHDYEWFSSMTDDDKNALIELLKTF